VNIRAARKVNNGRSALVSVLRALLYPILFYSILFYSFVMCFLWLPSLHCFSNGAGVGPTFEICVSFTLLLLIIGN
jgi:hypothetical protein